MEINLDEIAFERLVNEKLQAFSDTTPEADPEALRPEERSRLQNIFTNAHRKFNIGLTDQLQYLEAPETLTINEARELAKYQFDQDLATRHEQLIERADIMTLRQEKRIARVNKQFNERIARINTDAGRRGLLSSTAVIDQMQRAQDARNDAIDAHEAEIASLQARLELDKQRITFAYENRVEALAKRIHNESQRNAVAIVRERATQHTRNYNNWKSWQRTKLELNIEPQVQKAIQDEVFYEYKAFLLSQCPDRANHLVAAEPIFFFNLTHDRWTQMVDMLAQRT
ncbi:MAG: hypothetical protein FWE31_04500 [Firmicutes bacterium]|nr:hypothetical protein [Bacillota bacterium]